MLTARIAAYVDTLPSTLRAKRALDGPRARSRPGIAFADLGSVIIRYRVLDVEPEAQKPTVVLAADPPVVIEHYDELVELLARDFRIVVLELPGFGSSFARAGFRFDFATANAAIAELLQHLDLGPYILAFPCVAAYGAVALAAWRPELVSRLVLMQAPSWNEELAWKRRRDPRGLLSRPVLGQVALHALKRRRAPAWFEAAVGDVASAPSLARRADEAFADGAGFSLASAFQQYLVAGIELPRPKQPALVIWGERDASHASTDKSSSLLVVPHADELRFAEAGHFPELEAPRRFADALRSFARS